MKPSPSEKSVVTCLDGAAPFGSRYYLILHGKRHWICTPEAASQHNIDISRVRTITPVEMAKIPLSSPISAYPDSLEKCHDATEARAFLLKNLRGRGIEFGPGCSPLPIPPICDVFYADQYDDSTSGPANTYLKNLEFIPCALSMSMMDMSTIEDQSLDFILSSHVLEHVPITIKAIKSGLTKLKSGGLFSFSIPHRDLTFDNLRTLTPLSHFIADYTDYRAERDVLHVVDSYENISFFRNTIAAIGLLKACELAANGDVSFDMHYHTFNENNTHNLMNWFADNVSAFSEFRIHNHLKFSGANEFYLEIRK